MANSMHCEPEVKVNAESSNPLPLSSIVRALCQAATAGPELLYEVMLKLSLVVEATAPMYGLSIWNVEASERPKLQWAEGLQEAEIEIGEAVVAEAMIGMESTWPTVNAG